MDEKINKYQKKYIDLKNSINKIELELPLDQNKLDKLYEELDELVWNHYAKVIFEKYSKLNINLIDNYSKKEVSWDKAFGNDFNKIPRSLRESLVGLLNNDGKYKIK